MLVSLGIAAAAAIAVGVATTIVVMLQRRDVRASADELAQYKADAGVKIAEAIGAAAKANERAEQERLERTKLEASLAPRRLTEEQGAAIVASLRPFSGRAVRIVRTSMDEEAEMLARQIGACMKEVGIRANPAVMSSISVGPGGGAITSGVRVEGADAPLVKALISSLQNAGIAAGWTGRPASAQLQQTEAATVFVGAKPIPMLNSK